MEYEEGITIEQLLEIEECYKLIIPKSLKNLFMKYYLNSDGFYDWRNFSENNVNYLKTIINKPYKELIDNIEDIDWPNAWGNKPYNDEDCRYILERRIKKSPKLFPVYNHRYMPLISDDPPVLSIMGADVIYYGANLRDFFEIQFGNKNQSDINFDSVEYVPFWTDLI